MLSKHGLTLFPYTTLFRSRPPRSRTTGASSSTSSSELVPAGRVGRPHGLDGSFHVLQPSPDLATAESVVVAGRPRLVERRSEEHTSELQSRLHLVCRLLLE